MHVLVAPDCYGDSLTAVEATNAIAAGWSSARPADELIPAPQSDGGPGFVRVLSGRIGEIVHSRVSGPLDQQVAAEWIFDAQGRAAYIECAQACGLALLGGPPTARSALAAHSGGVGQLIDHALRAGATTIVVGLGGSGCTDGGRGMVTELGGLSAARDALVGVELIAATDVDHPLLGPMGAARVFGPQKGADPRTVELLERRLAQWAVQLDEIAGRSVSGWPGAGAAGGLGAALLALGGRRESGAAVVAERTGLTGDIARSDLVITGEGRFDDQSLHGKVVSALTGTAQRMGVPVVVLAGQVALDPATLRDAGIMAAYSLSEHAGSVRLAIDDAANQLSGLARRTAATLSVTRE